MSVQKSAEPFEVILIGDTGDISRLKTDPVLQLLKAHLNPGIESAVLFLGDNIYPRGMPPPGNILRKDAENTLKQYYAALKDYPGKIVFIAGNHDWNNGRKDGYEYILRQENYLRRLFQGHQVFVPSNGCPGPVEISLTEEVVVIAIDTQWWMQHGFRPLGRKWKCGIESEEEFFESLIDMLEKNKNRHIIVTGHHPVYSYAIHGGRFQLKHHIFPLTLYDKDAWIPLPGLGSLLPLYRKFLGAREDMSYPKYRRLRKRLKEIFSAYPGLIYAAGHEHNLQYIYKKRNHFFISGSGSKTKYVVQNGKYLEFGIMCKGFFKIRFEPDGAVFASAWALDRERHKPGGNLLYEKQII